MKPIFVSLTLAIFLPASTFAAGSEAIIKQRAKELRDQNNVRQGVPPPAPPQQPTKPNATQPAALTPVAKLQADLAAIKPNSQVTAKQKRAMSWAIRILISFGLLSVGALTGLAQTKVMNSSTNHTEVATLGGGCFWCTEAIYQMLPGVKSVTSGYAGGKKESPTYKE